MSQIDGIFRPAIQAATGVDQDPTITLATNETFGDYQANAAMGLAKKLGAAGEKTNPRAVAEKIIAALGDQSMLTDLGIAGPGFINMRLSPPWVQDQIRTIGLDPRLGVEPSAAPVTTVIDYSSPNVAKQMHVGHLRSTIIGDALSRIIDFLGHPVIRQNHIGDWGTQFGMLIAHLKSSGKDAGGHISDLEQFYRDSKKQFDDDPAFQDEARQTVVRLQAGDPEILDLWKQIVAESRLHYQPIYERLGVKLTEADECGESFYNPMLAGIVEELKKSGIAVESEGATAVFVDGFKA
ncbi:MAG: arginine--tRNA ligase, partial [Candidatus Sumerlaeaceae bacterium]|nr:arginine--tRNA ligase [Candidatus Sumerlaeaceae bacterium]